MRIKDIVKEGTFDDFDMKDYGKDLDDDDRDMGKSFDNDSMFDQFGKIWPAGPFSLCGIKSLRKKLYIALFVCDITHKKC